ncbi:MAG: cytidine deaminase [Firmicutes bacterium]|nr:cytidine/deoxycytidylate deaminase family protein [Bacillota bacterium]NLL87932.1 cytidine deaminase [Bacillota bacterium]HKM17405.1 cytidine/deoxycytidylate deaminase family protein [Limnochordia bacterium]
MPERPSWEHYFMEIAKLVSFRSTCLRRKVGAVLVKDKHVIATGYNGAASGLAHCSVRGCLRAELNIPSGQRHEMCRGVHAEQNAIIQAALHGVSTSGAVLYCTDQPCILCSKMLINAGITKIYFQGDYPDPLAREMLNEANVTLVMWESEE